MPGMPCIAHNRCLTCHVFRKSRELIHTVRKVVEFIKKSPNNTKVFDISAEDAERNRQAAAQEKEDVLKERGLHDPDVSMQIKARRTKHLTSDVSQRWTSTITMLYNVLLHWAHINTVYTESEMENPLLANKRSIVHLYSLVHPFGDLVLLAQTTNEVIIVPCVLTLKSLFKTTLKLGAPLKIHDPSRTGDGADGGVIEDADLDSNAAETRKKLAKAMEEQFLHRYAIKDHGDIRQWYWDLGMMLYPPTLPRKFEYMNAMLRLQFPPTRGTIWEKEELITKVEEKLFALMVKVETSRRTKRQEASATATPDTGRTAASSVPASLYGYDAKAMLETMYGEDESSREAGCSREEIISEMCRDELYAYKTYAKRTIETEFAKPKHQGCIKIAITGQAMWWEQHKSTYPIMYEVWKHVASHLMSSAQIERDFEMAN